jgi:aldehyde reductase
MKYPALGPQDDVDYLETWRGMETCRSLGLTRSIGVSNFNCQQLSRLLEAAVVAPAVNQIEVHINLNQKQLREFCASKSIAVTAYSPFGAPGRCSEFQPPGPEVDLRAPEVTALAKKYGKTNAQIALRYLVSQAFLSLSLSLSLSLLFFLPP